MRRSHALPGLSGNLPDPASLSGDLPAPSVLSDHFTGLSPRRRQAIP